MVADYLEHANWGRYVWVGLVFACAIAVTSPAVAQLGGGSCPLSAQERGTEVERTFTSSTGRTLRFHFMVPSDIDPSAKQGIAMYFHGNNVDNNGTFFPRLSDITEEAAAHGLVPVVGLSPETLVLSEGISRNWMVADHALIRELLASDFGGCIPLDHSKVFFIGDSQGTCFISEALLSWLWRDYRGGIYGGCGCWTVSYVDTNIAQLRGHVQSIR